MTIIRRCINNRSFRKIPRILVHYWGAKHSEFLIWFEEKLIQDGFHIIVEHI